MLDGDRKIYTLTSQLPMLGERVMGGGLSESERRQSEYRARMQQGQESLQNPHRAAKEQEEELTCLQLQRPQRGQAVPRSKEAEAAQLFTPSPAGAARETQEQRMYRAVQPEAYHQGTAGHTGFQAQAGMAPAQGVTVYNGNGGGQGDRGRAAGRFSSGYGQSVQTNLPLTTTAQ